MGKRNWMFIGHLEAGGLAAALYSILICATNHGFDPQTYLKELIERLPALRPGGLDALLLKVWAAEDRTKHPASGHSAIQRAA